MAHRAVSEIPYKRTRHGKLLVAAIDFGTTCTGYAYSLTQHYEEDPLNIRTKQSWKGSVDISIQAPTSILFDTNRKFHSFGFEAENKYKDFAAKQTHRQWFFFKHFKMMLHRNKNLTRDTELEASNQGLMKAIDVFSEAIRAVTDHLYSTITTECGHAVKRSEIRWVLTVPAIWSDSAKMFMREAAEKAGIEGDQLVLALEPEAASIYCKEQAIIKEAKDGGAILRHFNPGEKYMVLDLGGGTVDVTIHQVNTNGTLNEVYSASGGPWGGITVNEAFRNSIEVAVGKDIFLESRNQDQYGWIMLEKQFEDEKRKFYPGDSVSHRLHLPKYFTHKKYLDLAEQFKVKYGDALEVEDNFYLVIDPSMMEEYFDAAIYKIKYHIHSLLRKEKLGNISSIMLVGGFAESRVVQDKITKTFTTKSVFVPPEAGVSVLKGAMMFGHSPNIIAERISPWTYGVHTRAVFDKRRHDTNRIKKIGGKEYVENAFVKYLEIGESVLVGGSTLSHVFTVANRKVHRVFWKVYKSEKKNPVYCNEEGVHCLGTLEVELPKDKENWYWRLKLNMTCRGTELEAIVSDADTEELFKTLRFDFLKSEYGLESDFIQE
ncbi:hypothetical protein CHS0354_017152 [Potamilus streckersoni]|uniref:Heat shock 70 kDa protein 12A n=1 Tax=Potamilus streckersoni TaxID=2493646 RepID=A0AAE0T3Q1_9BIVA|nr:hypothetical protein CHS0354_017152 [Potamilus streckersoni]